MIILIAGASHTGKTLLASRLIEKYVYQGRVYSCLSLDLLKMGLIRSGNTALTPYDDEKLTPYLWSIAREIIRTALENNQNLIVEGCYIPFDFMNDFTADQRDEIKYICLVMTRNYIMTHTDDITRFGSVIEKRPDDTVDIPELIADNERNLAECRARGLGFILIDKDYDAAQRTEEV